MRRALLLAVLAVPGAGASATAYASELASCRFEQSVGIGASFGHRHTRLGAQELAARAQHVGFKGLVLQRRGCRDYAVIEPGLHSLKEGRAFQREARSVGFRVTLECRSHPVEGGLAAVFGHRRTRAAARRLSAAAEHVGFKNLQVQQDRCNDWEVDLYGLKTAAQRRDFKAEARSVGFHVVFERG